MTAPVVPLRPAGDVTAAAAEALAALHRHLGRCKLSDKTVKAYKRQGAAFTAWLAAGAADHGDAFADAVGAEAAVTAWRRHLLDGKAAPSSVNQALAAVTLLYAQAGMRIKVKRARVPRPGEPDALTKAEQGRVERAAARRGARDRAITAVMLYAGRAPRNASDWTPRTSPSPREPGTSASTARATRSAPSRSLRPPAGTWATCWPSEAPTTGHCG